VPRVGPSKTRPHPTKSKAFQHSIRCPKPDTGFSTHTPSLLRVPVIRSRNSFFSATIRCGSFKGSSRAGGAAVAPPGRAHACQLGPLPAGPSGIFRRVVGHFATPGPGGTPQSSQRAGCPAIFPAAASPLGADGRARRHPVRQPRGCRSRAWLMTDAFPAVRWADDHRPLVVPAKRGGDRFPGRRPVVSALTSTASGKANAQPRPSAGGGLLILFGPVEFGPGGYFHLSRMSWSGFRELTG